MATIEITQDNLSTTIDENDIVILDFWASWCGPCRAFGPVFEAASENEEHASIAFGKIDTEAQQQLAGELEISSIPTIMVFRETVLVYRQAGALPPPALQDLLVQIKSLDMDEVRAKVAEHAAEH